VIGLETELSFGKKVSLESLKHSFSQKFPDIELSQILLSEPDKMSVEELIAKCGTWLAILDSERNNNLNSEYIKGVGK
jgi:hypothetical protein